MAEYYPNPSYVNPVNKPAYIEDSKLSALGKALKAGEKYDPSLKQIPLQQTLSIILNERQKNYGALPVKSFDLKSSDDRNTYGLLQNLGKEGLDPDAAHAVATLSTKNKIATRRKIPLPVAWNGGGDPLIEKKVKGVSDALDAYPEHKRSVFSAFRKGYGEEPVTVAPPPDPSWYDKIKALLRDTLGVGQ